MCVHFGKLVVINSGLRCEAHSKKVGGAKESQHMKGTAADIRIAGVSPNDVRATRLVGKVWTFLRS